MTGGYQFSRGRTNQKRHKTHKSCSSIRPVPSKIFTSTAVSLPTDMQPPRCGVKPSRRGEISRFVATEVIQFVLYFLFLFEIFRHHPELTIGMRLVHDLRILLARILTGIFRMKRSALRGMSSSLLHRIPIRRGLYRQLRERDFAGGVKRMTGMLAKKSSLEKARGAVRREIVAAVVMAEAETRTIMKSVRTASLIMMRQLYIRSSEILSKGTITVIQKTVRTIFPASTRRFSYTRN